MEPRSVSPAAAAGLAEINAQARGRSSTPPVSHARRDAVRTPSYQPRQQVTQPPRQDNTRPAQNNGPQNNGQSTGDQRPANQGNGNSRPGNNRPGNNSGPAVRLPRVPNTPQRQNERKFTKTTQGRLYDNGLQLHKGHPPTLAWQRPYFPHGSIHYTFYAPAYSKGHVFI